MTAFEKELESLINTHCLDSTSETPDFILASYLSDCLSAYRKATCWVAMWKSPEGVPKAFRESGPSLSNFKQ